MQPKVSLLKQKRDTLPDGVGKQRLGQSAERRRRERRSSVGSAGSQNSALIETLTIRGSDLGYIQERQKLKQTIDIPTHLFIPQTSLLPSRRTGGLANHGNGHHRSMPALDSDNIIQINDEGLDWKKKQFAGIRIVQASKSSSLDVRREMHPAPPSSNPPCIDYSKYLLAEKVQDISAVRHTNQPPTYTSHESTIQTPITQGTSKVQSYAYLPPI